MAEQNILTGNEKVLEQIISDIREHNDKTECLDKLSADLKQLDADIASAKKALNDEVEARLRESTDAICSGYNKSIANEKDKLKSVQDERNQAKQAGVKERIEKETASVREENDRYILQINEEFKKTKIPGFCSSRIYFALFHTKGVIDALIYLLFMIVLFAGIPLGLSFIPGFPVYGILAYYFIVALAVVTLYKVIYDRTLLHNVEAIDLARSNKNEIRINKKKIRRIEKQIKNDKSEDMYNLDEFDVRIKEQRDNISRIETQKAQALEEFNKKTKPDIIAEIEGRSHKKIETMISDYNKKTKEKQELSKLVDDQRIYISSNYEAYLGKEFSSLDVLQELDNIMKSQAVQTISQALVVYKNRH